MNAAGNNTNHGAANAPGDHGGSANAHHNPSHHYHHHVHGNTRWKSASSSHSNVNTYRNMILLEKKRKSHEAAVSDMNNVLLDETLAGLRQKAHDLQNDKWMYEDVRM